MLPQILPQVLTFALLSSSQQRLTFPVNATYSSSVFLSGHVFSVRAALSLHFLCAPLSFVGNTEIDVDIKKYYCRAGIKSIQVCLQGCRGLFAAAQHCCSRHRREAERSPSHLTFTPLQILCAGF